MKELNLRTGNIRSLVRKFSIPCVISMVVAALYNIVDQLFIGWSEAGAYGNAATNIVYPFTVFSLGLALIVGDGSPKYAMACTLAGAITNIVLDPVFIFGFDMGVKGAAIATIAGQIITFAMSIAYLIKSKNFTIGKEAVEPDVHILGRIFSVGMAALIVQLSIVVIIAVNNNLLTKYGYETLASTGKAYGAVIPLAVVGIVIFELMP